MLFDEEGNIFSFEFIVYLVFFKDILGIDLGVLFEVIIKCNGPMLDVYMVSAMLGGLS